MAKDSSNPHATATIHWASLLVALVFVAASARLYGMIDRYAVNVLFWDQWEFWEALIDDQGYWELFR